MAVNATLVRLLRVTRLGRFARSRKGSIATEFGLIMPIIALGMVTMYDVGSGVIWEMRIKERTRTAVTYVMANASDQDRLEDAIENLNSIVNSIATVSSTTFCECPGQVAVVCGGECDSGARVREFLEISATRQIDTLLVPKYDVTVDTTLRMN